jgi:hypothetical protein
LDIRLGDELMIDDEEGNRRARVTGMRSIFAALALAIGVCLLSAPSRASERPLSGPGRDLGALLAAASENIVSESAMAQQTGAGLHPPGIDANEANSAPKVMLWDEIKASPILNPAQDGVVTGSSVSGR